MSRCYLGVADRAYVRAAMAAGVCLFAGGKAAPVEKLRPGDRVVYYAPKVSHGGAPLQRFVAMGEVTGTASRWKDDWPDHPGFEAWVRDCDWRAEAGEAPIRPLLEVLDFIGDSADWGLYLRDSQREIGAEDHGRIARAMLEPAS